MTDERPILFTGAMVRALLDGSKTQTRRVCKPRSDWLLGSRCVLAPHELAGEVNQGRYGNSQFGQPGDQLWVRETWARTAVWPAAEMVIYREGDNRTDYGGPWKPGIHMFRRDSRITLEVVSVRVERLQDISEADAIAEGVKNSLHLPGGRFAKENYEHLWWTIHGDGSWEANPWVWVVEFRRKS